MQPRNEVIQVAYQNPHASMPLYLPVLVIGNMPDEIIERNVRANSALPLEWLEAKPAHDGIAIIVGGGPSVADHVEDIRRLVAQGGTVFAMNAASRWLRGQGIAVDYQVIADAKPETATLVDPSAREWLFASQVDAATMLAAPRPPTLWHLAIDFMEKLFPAERVAKPNGMTRGAGYALIGGGAAVGNSAMVVAYALGYRALHAFGFDSSHRGKASHAYAQPMNALIPVVDVEWAGQKFRSSVAMKAQAEKFQVTAQELQNLGCTIEVHGDGLLPTMWRTPPANLNERDKYRALWQFDGYRDVSPGEMAVPVFLAVAKPDGPVIDFGCGTGRASLELVKAGIEVMLTDFADNCRDNLALALPFFEWDLTHPCPLRAPYGLCCDVMEHIPTADVDTVIRNIMGSAGKAFFQISTVPDEFGAVVHQHLHNTVQAHQWWAERFTALGFRIDWQEEGRIASRFYVSTTGQN